MALPFSFKSRICWHHVQGPMWAVAGLLGQNARKGWPTHSAVPHSLDGWPRPRFLWGKPDSMKRIPRESLPQTNPPIRGLRRPKVTYGQQRQPRRPWTVGWGGLCLPLDSMKRTPARESLSCPEQTLPSGDSDILESHTHMQRKSSLRLHSPLTL